MSWFSTSATKIVSVRSLSMHTFKVIFPLALTPALSATMSPNLFLIVKSTPKIVSSMMTSKPRGRK